MILKQVREDNIRTHYNLYECDICGKRIEQTYDTPWPMLKCAICGKCICAECHREGHALVHGYCDDCWNIGTTHREMLSEIDRLVGRMEAAGAGILEHWHRMGKDNYESGKKNNDSRR